MEMSGQLHDTSSFTPSERDPRTHWIGGWVVRKYSAKFGSEGTD